MTKRKESSRAFNYSSWVLFAAFVAATAGGREACAGFLVNTYESNSRLYAVNPDTGSSTLIGATGVGFMTDLAYAPSGVLYASSLGSLYKLNATTAASTLVGNFGSTSSVVGLTYSATLGLVGVDQSGNFLEINTSTGAATVEFNTGYLYTGDVANLSGSLFYGTATEGDGSHLIKINTSTSTATDLGVIASGQSVAGLDFDSTGRLVAFASSGVAYAISNYATSGTGTALGNTGIDVGGATFVPATVPEPGSMILTGLGLASAVGLARRGRPQRSTCR